MAALGVVATYALGSLAFLMFWVLAVFPRFPALPIGRTSGALLGATLMVVFQIETTEEAYEAIDLPILGLLFGTMVVSIYLERAGLFNYLGRLLSWGSPGPKSLMCRLCIVVAITSALFTNDTACVAMTGFVLKLCREKGLPAEPFLVALATSSNIGSAATPIGNPQNLIIAVQGKISFGKFLSELLPSVIVGTFVNTVMLLLVYWKRLSPIQGKVAIPNPPLPPLLVDGKEIELPTANPFDVQNRHADKNSQGFDNLGMKRAPSAKLGHSRSDGYASMTAPYGHISLTPSFSRKISRSCHVEHQIKEEEEEAQHKSDAVVVEITKQSLEYSDDSVLPNKSSNGCFVRNGGGEVKKSTGSIEVQSGLEKKPLVEDCDSVSSSLDVKEDGSVSKLRRFRKLCVFLVTLGMLAALLYGLDMSWSALTAAVLLMVLDFKDSGSSLDKVSYSLLVFFAGMFITVDGFNRTGIPGVMWRKFEPLARINHVSGVVMLTIVIVILSNIASNVPTVLLLGPQVAASAEALQKGGSLKAWLILAWVSTVAGNLTLVGSAANLIVSEQAKRDESSPTNLSCSKHLRFGPFSTCIITFIGLPLIQLTMLNG